MFRYRIGLSAMLAIGFTLCFILGPIGGSLSPVTKALLASMCSASMFSVSIGIGSGDRGTEMPEWIIKILAHVFMLVTGIAILIRMYGVSEDVVGPMIFFVGFCGTYLFWMWTGRKEFFHARSDVFTMLALLILIGIPALTIGGIHSVSDTFGAALAMPLVVVAVNLFLQWLMVAAESNCRQYGFPLEYRPLDIVIYFALFVMSVSTWLVFEGGPSISGGLIALALFCRYTNLDFLPSDKI